jgi:hypothetical protein
MINGETSLGKTDEWFTPPSVFEKLGCEFDMDVASPGRYVTPWISARTFITKDSLETEWHGFIWMNPPFGGRNGIVPWLKKFVDHGNGIALTPDRTSAPWWQQFAPLSDLILFVSPKIKFIDASGKPGPQPAQGTTLLGIGPRAVDALHHGAENGLGFLMEPARTQLAA